MNTRWQQHIITGVNTTTKVRYTSCRANECNDQRNGHQQCGDGDHNRDYDHDNDHHNNHHHRTDVCHNQDLHGLLKHSTTTLHDAADNDNIVQLHKHCFCIDINVKFNYHRRTNHHYPNNYHCHDYDHDHDHHYDYHNL
jgi:hypothetical protein